MAFPTEFTAPLGCCPCEPGNCCCGGDLLGEVVSVGAGCGTCSPTVTNFQQPSSLGTIPRISGCSEADDAAECGPYGSSYTEAGCDSRPFFEWPWGFSIGDCFRDPFCIYPDVAGPYGVTFYLCGCTNTGVTRIQVLPNVPIFDASCNCPETPAEPVIVVSETLEDGTGSYELVLDVWMGFFTPCCPGAGYLRVRFYRA